MAQAFERVVVEIDVCQVDFVLVERVGINGKTMVLRGDFYFVGDLVEHRVIATAVAEFQLEGLAAESQAKNLMAEANAEDGSFTHQLADLSSLVLEGLGVSGAVGEEDAIRFEGENIFSTGASRHYGDVATNVGETPKDVALDAEIVGDHIEARSRAGKQYF